MKTTTANPDEAGTTYAYNSQLIKSHSFGIIGFMGFIRSMGFIGFMGFIGCIGFIGFTGFIGFSGV